MRQPPCCWVKASQMCVVERPHPFSNICKKAQTLANRSKPADPCLPQFITRT